MDSILHTSTDQESTNKIWKNVWDEHLRGPFRLVFQQRLFLEGYPVIRKYVPDRATTLLDSGGGTGRYGLKLAMDLPQSQVTISDILPEALEIAGKLAADLNISNVTMQKDDVTASVFSDNTFDVIVSDVVIQHIPDYRTAIQEMKRITKPGGRIIVSAMNVWNFHTITKKVLPLFGKSYEYGYEKSFSRRELARVMQEEGLSVMATDGFYVGYGIFRLKAHHAIFHLLGRIVNRISKVLDRFTGRFFSRNFGFEILVVAEKP